MLGRLAIVFVTVVAATLLIHFWGPPLPYRVGEVSPVDLRVRAYFELENQPQTQRAREEAVERLPPALQQDPAACARARHKQGRSAGGRAARPSRRTAGRPLPD